MKQTYDLRLADSAIQTVDAVQRIHVKKPRHGREKYRVKLSLEGRDLPYVRSITYRLHPTFTPNECLVERTRINRNCSLILWAWGMFPVHAEVQLRSGQKLHLSHQLDYGEKFEQVEFVNTAGQPEKDGSISYEVSNMF